MLDRVQSPGSSTGHGDDTMTKGDNSDQREVARRFREAALPHLDDVYSLARYLLRNSADAEDAAQECYLRALRHFHTFRGTDIKPWLLAICAQRLPQRVRAPFDHLARDRLQGRGGRRCNPSVAGAGGLA